MTPEHFVYWVQGYIAAQIDCQIKTDIEKAIAKVVTQPTNTVTFRESNKLNSDNTGNLTGINYIVKKELQTDTVF